MGMTQPSMLDNTYSVVQGEPEFKRYEAALKAEHAKRKSGRSSANIHLGLMTDEPGLAERCESLGATLRVRHASLCRN